MAEDRSTKAYKGLSQKETREKLIRDRAARLAEDAAKQGITPAQLAKKKRDTYIKVVGGAASLLPIGRIISLASKGFKALQAGTKAAKVGKVVSKSTKSKTPAAKAGARAKSQSTAVTVGSKAKTPAAKAGARAKSQSTAVTVGSKAKTVGRAKPTREMRNITPPKGSSVKRTKITTKSPKKSTMPISKGKAAAIIGTTAGLTGAALLGSKGQKKAAASVTAPTSRPKRPTKKTSMSKGNTVAGSSGRRGGDPRKGFASKATPGPKKVAPTPKRKPKDKNDPRGNQVKAMSSLPAGALRKFQGSYNKKKEKLKNIGGKTYVMKR